MNREAQAEPADIATSSDDYAQRFAGPIGAWLLARQTDIVLALLKPHSGGEVLDVGGGHAQLARPLVDAGFAVTVHGSAPQCGQRIRDLTARGACRFVCAPMLELPFEAAAIDTVVCFRLITHCPQWPELVAELCRVAKHAIIVDYPTHRSLNALSDCLFSFKKKLEGNTRTWKLFHREEILAEFARHGFACSEEKKQFFLPMVLHRVLRCPGLSTLLEGLCRGMGLTRLWGSPVIMKVTKDRQCSNVDAWAS